MGISRLFDNPMDHVTVIISSLIIIYLMYKLCQVHKFLKYKLHTNLADHIPKVPTAPPPYITSIMILETYQWSALPKNAEDTL